MPEVVRSVNSWRNHLGRRKESLQLVGSVSVNFLLYELHANNHVLNAEVSQERHHFTHTIVDGAISKTLEA